MGESVNLSGVSGLASTPWVQRVVRKARAGEGRGPGKRGSHEEGIFFFLYLLHCYTNGEGAIHSPVHPLFLPNQFQEPI